MNHDLKIKMLSVLTEFQLFAPTDFAGIKIVKDSTRKITAILPKLFHLAKGRWFLRSCQIQGLPRVKGKLVVRNSGSIVVRDRVFFDAPVVPIEIGTGENGRLEIGERTYINYGTSISASKLVRIGNRCLIGTYCILMDDDYHGIEDRHSPPPPKSIILEDNVWLGARVTILKGVTIGHDSVIGAGSVVTKSIPPRSVAVGVPASVIKTF